MGKADPLRSRKDGGHKFSFNVDCRRMRPSAGVESVRGLETKHPALFKVRGVGEAFSQASLLHAQMCLVSGSVTGDLVVMT